MLLECDIKDISYDMVYRTAVKVLLNSDLLCMWNATSPKVTVSSVHYDQRGYRFRTRGVTQLLPIVELMYEANVSFSHCGQNPVNLYQFSKQ